MTTPSELATQLTNAANNVAIIDACSNIIQFFKQERDNLSANLVYDIIGDLPTANSMYEGMTAYVLNDALYICDGTQWYDVVTPGTEPWKFQGQTEGIITTTSLQSFPFASDVNATSFGSISYGRTDAAGCSGPVYGYQIGSTNYTPKTNQSVANIMKFPFANSGSNASKVGDLMYNISDVGAYNNETYGYSKGGWWQAYPSPYYATDVSHGYKFPFTSDTDAAWSTSLVNTRSDVAGVSGPEYGYTVCGWDGQYYNSPNPSVPYVLAYSQYAEKFSFSSDTRTSWTFIVNRAAMAGQSSEDNGYVTGGSQGSPTYSTNRAYMYKFPFASETDESYIGNLDISRRNGSGISSVDNGYHAAGEANSPYSAASASIEKFPFASDTGASDVADLAFGASTGTSGHQY